MSKELSYFTVGVIVGVAVTLTNLYRTSMIRNMFRNNIRNEINQVESEISQI